MEESKEEKKLFFKNILSKFLGKKETRQEQVQNKEEVTTPKQEVVTSSPPIEGEKCDVCGMAIYGEQRVVHKFGKAYHLKPCWRSKMKEAKNMMVGY